VLVVAPNSLPYRLLGAASTNDVWNFRSYAFDRLLALARNNVPAAVVTDLAGEDLTRAEALVVLARSPEELTLAESEQLRTFVRGGRPVVAPASLRPVLGDGAIYPEAAQVEDAFGDSPTPQHRAMWQRALGVTRPIQGYYVATEEAALFYSLRGDPTTLQVRLPFSGSGYVAEPNGTAGSTLRADREPIQFTLRANQYALFGREQSGEHFFGRRP
jgi:hypothetical protein